MEKEDQEVQDLLFSAPGPDRMFYKIRDVAKLVGVKPHVLRYWETEFPQLSPQKNKNGQRVYTRKDVELAIEIRRLLHHEKFSIAGARQALKKKRGHSPPARETSAGPSAALMALKETRDELAGILDTLKSPV
ncbi:MAG: MerR family transcriptional regulator [Nitrospinae bacterium]|nr:MerR family transcriptional regulator [Nitrospinota bacterium]